jgi:hypothetical protein
MLPSNAGTDWLLAACPVLPATVRRNPSRPAASHLAATLAKLGRALHGIKS